MVAKERLTITPAQLRRWFTSGVEVLDRNRQTLDDLNTFPLPDFNTGAHLLATFRRAGEAVAAAPDLDNCGEIMGVAAGGALAGAHGSAGYLLAATLRHWAQSWVEKPTITPIEMITAFADLPQVYQETVGTVIPFTFSGIAADISQALEGMRKKALFPEVIMQAVVTAQAVLTDSADARKGVADAGLFGWTLLLAAFADAVDTGGSEFNTQVVEAMLHDFADCTRQSLVNPARRSPGGEFEVCFEWETTVADMEAWRQRLTSIGFDLAIVGGADEFGVGNWLFHLHTPTVVAALPSSSDVTARIRHLDPPRLSGQGTEAFDVSNAGDNVVVFGRTAPAQTHSATLGMVAVTRAPGLLEMLARTGAVVAYQPRTQADIASAVAETGCDYCVILPVDDASRDLCLPLAGERVAVAPTADEVSVMAISQDVKTWIEQFWPHFATPAAAWQEAKVFAQSSAFKCVTMPLLQPDTAAAVTRQLIRDYPPSYSEAPVIMAVFNREDGQWLPAELAEACGEYPEVSVELLHGGQSGASWVGVWRRQ